MPPFSMAWLVTQTDNGTGNQLKKVHHPSTPPPPILLPLRGADQQRALHNQKWLSLSCSSVQQWVIADFVCRVIMWPSSTRAKAQESERERTWPPFSGPLPHLLPPLPCFFLRHRPLLGLPSHWRIKSAIHSVSSGWKQYNDKKGQT